ncbi:Tat (twin-arginine translocation) pathway signal sequence containing protein [Sphingobacteriaceae bacterium]|nr:Tat (twin-arginine translocation) pathway signal sequence containing protein [Sphingobacteriaceae bacterium]
MKKPIGRGGFLKYTGAVLATTGLVMAGCKKDKKTEEEAPPATEDKGVNLGSGDIGVLNYAYALEQLEAAFYTKVMDSPFSGMTAEETQILSDLKLHEIAHREFLKAALGASAIQALEVNFASIDFTNRSSVLNTAKAFEDLGVAAYNGAGKLIVDPNYLLIAGKIVSVEARHASAIRDLLNPKSSDFAGDDVIDINGLDGAKTPSQVLAIAGSYIKTKIDASNLPTS